MSKYIELTCTVCQNIFPRLLKQYTYEVKRTGGLYSPVCGKECKSKFRSKKQKVVCESCGKTFEKKSNQIAKTKQNFCSSSCFVSTNNKSVVRSKVKNRVVKCVVCKLDISVRSNTPNNVAHCGSCKPLPIRRKSGHPKRIKKPYDIICQMCNVNVPLTKYSKRKYCIDCLPIARTNAGLKSVAAQSISRRSKNEIYFAELCQQHFSKITTNDPIFVSKYGNWDADVIIHDHKIAVLWNGIWHTKKVRQGHSVKQVQARDKIKLDVIKNNGYIPYVISDLGKENQALVEKEFKKFLGYIDSTISG